MIKIENFCENNVKYISYYNFLNNTENINKLLIKLKFLKHPIIKKKILKMIEDNHKIILHNINLLNIVISYYIQNNLINKSEIGVFFKFYQKNIKKTNIMSYKSLLIMFYKIADYDNLLSLLKEIFYIFSNYRTCLYYMTPSINFYNTKKETIKNIVIKFRDNLNTLNQIITKVYIGDKNPWGSSYYSTAFSMFETLIILKKYFKDPIKLLKIEFKVNKMSKDVIKDICYSYQTKKIKDSDIDNKLNPEYINNVSQFIVNIKRLGYDLWFVIPLIFNSIFQDYIIKGIPDSKIFSHDKIYFQTTNNYLGFMCFILVKYGFITNVNIFHNFND
jgi:hypothetical protein